MDDDQGRRMEGLTLIVNVWPKPSVRHTEEHIEQVFPSSKKLRRLNHGLKNRKQLFLFRKQPSAMTLMPVIRAAPASSAAHNVIRAVNGCG